MYIEDWLVSLSDEWMSQELEVIGMTAINGFAQ